MTRRASTIKGLAFSIEDFELGPQVGSGFFGKVRKVRHKYSELIGVEVLQFHNWNLHQWKPVKLFEACYTMGFWKNILSGYRISQLSQFEEQFGNLDEIQVKFIAL